MVKRIFKIPDMHCANCVMRLESLEDELEGVRSITASYHKLTFEIEYDECVIAEDTIKKAIVKLGYQVEG
jgi:copper chaperone